MITGLSHVSIVVPNLEAAARELEAKYRLKIGAIKVNEEQGVRMAYVQLSNARIELMEPSGDESPVAKFLQRNPHGGIHHFSLEVDDMVSTKGEIERQGTRLLGDGNQKNVDGEKIAFVHPRDFLGALVELEEHGH
ncbi:MAG: epi [Betaproteobacteria bacterium]|nr:epi [Betaproteobacteria bacterium]